MDFSVPAGARTASSLAGVLTEQPLAMPPRILIVDDDPSAAQFCSDLLRSEGYETEICGTAEEAQRRLDTGGVDLVVLDVILPGTDGLALARQLAQCGADNIPIVLFTALTSETIDEPRLRASTGVRAVVYKPCRPRNIIDTIREIVPLRQP